MRVHNICFNKEIRKIIFEVSSIPLSGAQPNKLTILNPIKKVEAWHFTKSLGGGVI